MLRISKNAGLTDLVSDTSIAKGQPGYNPITTEHPTTGSTVDVRLFLFNDDPTKKYTTITIDPKDTTSADESTYVQLAPDNAGIAGTFLAASAALTMADVSDSNVAKAFWMRVTTPAVADSQDKTDIFLELNSKEYAV